jgi:hypothetical protein
VAFTVLGSAGVGLQKDLLPEGDLAAATCAAYLVARPAPEPASRAADAPVPHDSELAHTG